MNNNLESYNKAQLIELVKTQIEEYQKLDKALRHSEKCGSESTITLSNKIAELEKERDALDNQLNELYHAMELISKIATVVPRDTAILEVINCYRTGELLKAHNLEQQAKGVDDFADGNLVGNDLVVALRCIESLHKQVKQLREGVK